MIEQKIVLVPQVLLKREDVAVFHIVEKGWNVSLDLPTPMERLLDIITVQNVSMVVRKTKDLRHVILVLAKNMTFAEKILAY